MATASFIGRYRIDGVLGRGGVGVVYEGWDADLQRKVAIKVLRDSGGSGRVRLLREARAMAKLSHPNVATVFEVATHEGRDFIAIEMVDGTHLAEWLRAGRSRDEILRAFVAAGRGLAAAHAAGMIHRDFKPSNVLVRRDGRVVVTDFGLVRDELGASSSDGEMLRESLVSRPAPETQLDIRATTSDDLVARPVGPGVTPDAGASASRDDLGQAPTEVNASPVSSTLTETGAVLGTFGYMAPEQYRGRADARSDQFAYCVALWEALAGVPPFKATTHEEMVEAIERGPSGQLPGRLRAILARGLAGNPDERWPSMNALLAQLEPRRRAWSFAVIGAALASGGMALAVTHALRHDSASPAPAAPSSSSVVSSPRDLITGPVRHLTYDDGCEEFPSLTPDGKTVVFDAMVGGSYAIQAVDVATGRTRQLTRGEVWEYKPAVSPDGQLVAYLRAEPKGVSTYVIGIAGGAGGPAKRIGRGDMQPFWDPGGHAVWIGYLDKIELVDVDNGTVLRSLESMPGMRANEGTVLPDGRIAIIMFPGQGSVSGHGIAVYDKDGHPSWLVEASMLETIGVAPDRASLLVTFMTESNTHELWRVPIDRSPPSAVPGAMQPTIGISITPDGGLVAWSDCEPKTVIATLTGKPLSSTVLPTGTWTDQSPVAIPGTEQFVIVSDRDQGTRPWVVDLAHREPPRKLPAAGDVMLVAVSRDAKTLYTVVSSNKLLAQPLDGSRPPEVIASHVEGAPSPRSDGTIALTVDGSSISILPARGGTPKLTIADARTPAAAPDGDDLYFVSLAPSSKGAIMHRDKHGNTRPVSSELPMRPWSAIAVSDDGKRLALLQMSSLTIVDTATGHILDHYDAGAGMLTGVAWVGGTLVVSRADFQGDVWLLDRSKR